MFDQLVLLQIATAEGATACVLGGSYAAMPKIEWTNRRCATASPFLTQRIYTFADCDAFETIADLLHRSPIHNMPFPPYSLVSGITATSKNSATH